MNSLIKFTARALIAWLIWHAGHTYGSSVYAWVDTAQDKASDITELAQDITEEARYRASDQFQAELDQGIVLEGEIQ